MEGVFCFLFVFVLRYLKQVRLLMARSKVNRNKQGLKINIFVKYRTKQIKATETKK